MKQAILIIFGIGFLLAGAYFGWALHRISSMDDPWPGPWPYPDKGLLKLNDWFDVRFPAPRGCIKLEGEILKVRITMLCLTAMVTAAGMGCLSVYYGGKNGSDRRGSFFQRHRDTDI